MQKNKTKKIILFLLYVAQVCAIGNLNDIPKQLRDARRTTADDECFFNTFIKQASQEGRNDFLEKLKQETHTYIDNCVYQKKINHHGPSFVEWVWWISHKCGYPVSECELNAHVIDEWSKDTKKEVNKIIEDYEQCVISLSCDLKEVNRELKTEIKAVMQGHAIAVKNSFLSTVVEEYHKRGVPITKEEMMLILQTDSKFCRRYELLQKMRLKHQKLDIRQEEIDQAVGI